MGAMDDVTPETGDVLELRVALTVGDFDAAVAFYRGALGMVTQEEWDGVNGRGVIMSVDRATFEILDTAQSGFVDEVEVGRRGAGAPVRIAMRVADSAVTAAVLTDAGAQALGAPVATPWGHRNVRLLAPGDVQLTLFSVPE